MMGVIVVLLTLIACMLRDIQLKLYPLPKPPEDKEEP